jgi:hypothetical protein
MSKRSSPTPRRAIVCKEMMALKKEASYSSQQIIRNYVCDVLFNFSAPYCEESDVANGLD